MSTRAQHPMIVRANHDERVGRLARDYAALPAGEPVRLAKKTSNLFRRREGAAAGLDVSGLGAVIAVDPVARTADVQGMTTYEHLVAATLPHGLMPLVVPQLRTITLGGAVTGLGIESSSFANGCPHESVLEMEILTGGGQVVTATRDNDHADLFFGFPNSYGSLGYATRLLIELQPVQPYVSLRHVRFGSLDALAQGLREVCESGAYDFVDGTVFSAAESYLTLGTFAERVPYTSDYTGMQIYYRSIQQRRADQLSTVDYLWRWDTDWFWCSRAFGAQNPRLRRLWPKRWLRSDVYWKLLAVERTYHVVGRLDARRGRPPREDVVQDIEVPVDRVAEFVDFLQRATGIAPVWVCPLRQRDAGVTWPLYPLEPATLYVNVGFWSSVPLQPGEADGTINRRIEREVARLGGRKSLYSTSFYDEDEFWATYNGECYHRLKKGYDPQGRLTDLYAKCVRNR